jgi:uncharacterized membrane protein
MNELEIFLRLSLAGLSIVITIISLISFWKVKDGKMALASLGFCLFAVEGTLLSIGIFSPVVEAYVTVELMVGIAFLALIFFYLSILKR